MTKIENCPLIIAQTHGYVVERQVFEPSQYVCRIAVLRKMCKGCKKYLTKDKDIG